MRPPPAGRRSSSLRPSPVEIHTRIRLGYSIRLMPHGIQIEMETDKQMTDSSRHCLGCVSIRKMMVRRVTSDTLAHCSTFRLFVVIIVLS